VDNREADQLEQEQTVGRRAENAYGLFIEAFVGEKKKQLLSAFAECSISEVDTILEIKRTIYVLDTLETEIKTIIQTGKMASQSLNQKPMEKH